MAENKSVSLVIPSTSGNGNDVVLERVPVQPGDTSQTVLDSVGRGEGYIMGRSNGNIFRANEVLYPAIVEGEALFITPYAEAGNDEWADASASAPGTRWYSRLVDSIRGGPMASGAGIAHTKAMSVWKAKGWHERFHGVYEGYFATKFGPRKGRVEFGPSDEFRRLIIWDPPREIWKAGHLHAPCLISLGKKKYELHLNTPPTSVDMAIMNMERICDEAYSLSRGGDYEATLRKALRNQDRT